MGYKILGRNFRTRFGEIDLIARDGDCLVFAEVKTRTTAKFGLPEEAVTRTKQQHLIAASQIYLGQKKMQNALWRIDVLALLKKEGGFEVRHLKNAVFG